MEVRDQLDGIFARLKEKIDGVLVVKAHGREQDEMAGFAAQIDAAHQPRLRVGLLGAALTNLSTAAAGIGTALVFAAGALEVIHGRMTPGAVSSAGFSNWPPCFSKPPPVWIAFARFLSRNPM
jgi:ABC-type multidrug transport system fused ATPase/permease subunit